MAEFKVFGFEGRVMGLMLRVVCLQGNAEKPSFFGHKRCKKQCFGHGRERHACDRFSEP